MAEYIEREALRDELASLSVSVTGLRAGKGVLNEYMKQYRESVLRIVDEQPAADVAPIVHGRWVQCFEDWRKQIEGDKCSICGFEHYGTSIKHYLYCPNCGADMRGDTE